MRCYAGRFLGRNRSKYKPAPSPINTTAIKTIMNEFILMRMFMPFFMFFDEVISNQNCDNASAKQNKSAYSHVIHCHPPLFAQVFDQTRESML